MIDLRERFSDLQEALRVVMDDRQAQMWTCLPGVVQSTSLGANGKLTAVVQPAIQGTVRNRDGTVTHPNLPLIPDVPIVFPRGGGYALTVPVAAGDECLLVFASRCIDFWWQSGGVQPAVDARQHDLSDAFAIPGPYSQTTAIGNVSTATAQLRSADGVHYVEVDAPNGLARIVADPTHFAEADSKNGLVRLVAGGLSAVLSDTSKTLNFSMAGGTVTMDLGGGNLVVKNAATVQVNP